MTYTTGSWCQSRRSPPLMWMRPRRWSRRARLRTIRRCPRVNLEEIFLWLLCATIFAMLFFLFSFFGGWLEPWFLNSFSSSSCMNMATHFLNSSRSNVGFLHRLSMNGPRRKAITMWCKATSRLRSRICNANFPNLSINTRRDSHYSYIMLTSANNIRWCGLLVVNCVLKPLTRVSK